MTVRAIRGAVTVENNSAFEIIDETKALLTEIIKENNVEQDNIISIIFTATKDLDAAFPAVAARQLGWTRVALMCTSEIDVPGSLKSCIRVLLHINSEKSNSEIKNIYLKGAKVLRPDL
ncbi:chorismate mutase [Anaerobacterium chartisolvens]|uniref:chorismate mutase n=1 Tax=Anaerobacterium chartisolvens TaxID=1297424 RepID=A0A369BHM3_9FIRM|nr:chorismate mutase [Anaerobacterium chartisolvens]RCX19967.1 chorismate mutase [Anaerobacterium chartisolvens]